MLALPTLVLLAVAAAPPPLGPAPPPQPNCTTCKWPKHSWATVPASVHTSRRDTGPDGTFRAADLLDLQKFPLITMEKWQGTDAVDASGKRVFIWEEDAVRACQLLLPGVLASWRPGVVLSQQSATDRLNSPAGGLCY
jgi:hypothetical protein